MDELTPRQRSLLGILWAMDAVIIHDFTLSRGSSERPVWSIDKEKGIPLHAGLVRSMIAQRVLVKDENRSHYKKTVYAPAQKVFDFMSNQPDEGRKS